MWLPKILIASERCLVGVAALGIAAFATGNDDIEPHIARKSEAIVQNDLRVLGLPAGTVRMQGDIARIKITVQGQPADLEMNRLTGVVHVVQAPPQTREYLERRLSVPSFRAVSPAIVPVSISTGQSDSDAMSPCASNIQGRIAWTNAAGTNWPPPMLNRICSGAEGSTEPGRCFERVMRGGISWGGGTTWQPANAVNLCMGTHDSQKTISCFQSTISKGGDWQAAIAACQ